MEAISSLAAPASSRLDWNFFRSAAFSFWSSSTWTVSKEPLGLLGFFFSLNEIEDDEMRRNLFDVITLDVPKVLQRHHRLLRLGRFLMEGAPSSTTLPTLLLLLLGIVWKSKPDWDQFPSILDGSRG